MKKFFLLFAILWGVNFNSSAFFFDIPDTLNKKPIPILSTKNQSIDFVAPASSEYSISIENNGNIIYLDEVSLSLGEVYTIYMNTLPAGTYRILISDMVNGKEYEYFYRKDDNTETI
jgi:hypothetical protein